MGKVKHIELDLSILGDCKVTLDESVLLVPMVKSGDHWEAQDPIATLALRSPDEMTPRVTTVPGGPGTTDQRPRRSAARKAAHTRWPSPNWPRILSLPDYVLRGRVKYAGVAGDGYLELLNDFADRGTFFTRSLAASGMAGKLNGTSDWRDFELPFHAQPGMVPKSLTLNVVLPGAGTVTVADARWLSIHWARARRFAECPSAPWWTASQGGFHWRGPGSSRRHPVGPRRPIGGLGQFSFPDRELVRAGLAICCGALIGWLVAISFNQPWYVDCPLLLPAVIGLAAFGFNLRNALRQFQVDELRRMTAADVV